MRLHCLGGPRAVPVPRPRGRCAGGFALTLASAAVANRCAVGRLIAQTSTYVGASDAAGAAAAVSSSFLSTVGVFLWDQHWRGSAFALNLFKCTLASLLFGVVLALRPGGTAFLSALRADVVMALTASSLIGIVVGDLTWLLALKLVGIRKVLIIGSMEPFAAALAGRCMFDERTSLFSTASMLCTVLGVLMVSLETEQGSKVSSSGAWTDKVFGCALSVASVMLDLSAMVLTKQFAGGLDPWVISGFRFGCASVFMAVIALIVELRQRVGASKAKATWHVMPKLSVGSWGRVAAGVVFVTFLSPVMSNFALFAVPLSLCLTLGSLGPVFSIPLAWIIKSERASARSCFGTLLAVLGAISFINGGAGR